MRIWERLFGVDGSNAEGDGKAPDAGGVGRLVKAALQSPTSPEEATERVLARLRDSRPTRVRDGKQGLLKNPLRWKAVAASGAAGLVLGVVLGWIAFGTRAEGLTGSPLDIRIVALEGTVLVQRAGSATWRELDASSGILAGDNLLSSVGSRLTLDLVDESTLSLEPNSVLGVKHHDGGAELILDRGGLVADLRSPHPPFLIRTPQGKVEALGTKFRVTVK